MSEQSARLPAPFVAERTSVVGGAERSTRRHADNPSATMDQSLPLPTDAPRMAPLGRLPVTAAAHLELMGGLAWSWLVISRAGPGVFEAVVCAAPALLAFGLGFSSQADRQQYVVRLLACALMLPILLMMWAGSQDACRRARRRHARAPSVDLLHGVRAPSRRGLPRCHRLAGGCGNAGRPRAR